MNCYTLFSGSTGNCIYLQDKTTQILVDAGHSMRRINEALSAVGSALNQIDAIFLTHEHVDHSRALPMLTKHFSIPVYCQRAVAKELYLSLLSKSTQDAAALARCVRTVEPGEEYELGSILITPFQTPHDSKDSQGFIIGDRLLGIATDLGHVSDTVRGYLSGCRHVILESNHDLAMLENGPYPPYLKQRVASDHGHLNNRDAALFSAHLLEKGCESFTLFHLSMENNTPEIALGENKAALDATGAVEGADYRLQIADRYQVTKVL